MVTGATQSPLPRQQETFREVGDHPVFRDETILESTGDHVAPYNSTASGGKAFEVALVGGPQRSLPVVIVVAARP